MFEDGVGRDEGSRRMTRRVFMGAGVAALAGAAVLYVRRAPGVEVSAAVHGTAGEVLVVEFANDARETGRGRVAKVVKTDGAWRRQLGANSFDILRLADTETPFFGGSLREHRRGMFRCLGCGTALFASGTKFESGTGWPSFWAAVAKENVLEVSDGSAGMERTEVKCVRCEGHLGHVFDDGPAPTGLRYCMNSASMVFGAA